MGVNKGMMKRSKKDIIYPTLVDRDKGKRKVQINRNTWIYTDKPTDEEAIDAYNKRHGITPSQ